MRVVCWFHTTYRLAGDGKTWKRGDTVSHEFSPWEQARLLELFSNGDWGGRPSLPAGDPGPPRRRQAPRAASVAPVTWLLVAAPGGGLQAPPGFLLRPLLLGFAALAVYLFWQSGLLDPRHLRSPLPSHRLRRRAYRVPVQVFSMEPVMGNTKDPATRRAIQRHHQRQTIKTLKRDGGYVVYAEVHYKRGLDTGEGSKKRLEFEKVWEQEMTRPDKAGNAAHGWVWKWYVGSPVVLCRWAPLPAEEVIRLYQLLQPTFKWPEGTRPAEVIHASTDERSA
jgi:hypothetical protein